ncbi:hypothetical protein BH10PAT1_BH10PAT1_1350 [soil metagenome]
MEEQKLPNAPVSNETPVLNPIETKPKSNMVMIGLGIIILVLLIMSGYLGYQNMQLQKEITGMKVGQKVAVNSPTPVATVDPTAGWKTYTNNLWKFSISYPKDVLVECTPNDIDGLRLWRLPYECSPGDIFYEVSAIGYKIEDYQKSGTPISSTKKITIANVEATENIYTYTEADGPLMSSGSSREILIPTQNGVIQLFSLGKSTEVQNRFDQILSTFKFTQ